MRWAVLMAFALGCSGRATGPGPAASAPAAAPLAIAAEELPPRVVTDERTPGLPVPGAVVEEAPAPAISGRATDTGGDPLVAVTVVATGPALEGTQSAVTDADGRFVLTNLPPGEYTVTFYYAEFTVTRPGVRVRLAQPAVVDADIEVSAPVGAYIEIQGEAPSRSGVTMTYGCIGDFPPAVCGLRSFARARSPWDRTPRGRDSLYGTVTDSSGRAVQRARVVAKRVGTGEEFGTSTDLQGHYYLALLPSGRYDVTVVRSGQRDHAPGVVVGDGRRTALHLKVR